MRRKSLVTLLVAVLMLMLMVMAAAQAATVKLIPYKLNGPVMAKASGILTLTYDAAKKQTMLSGHITGLAKNATYSVYLYAPKIGFHHGLSFKTDAMGMGMPKATISGDHTTHLPAVINDDAKKITLLNSI